MSASSSVRLPATPSGSPSFFRRIPSMVFAVAALAAVLHLVPFWLSQLRTPPGAHFSGNTTNNPDYMQYRVWFRQTQSSGPVIANTFTSEPNTPHLVVVFYYLVGKTARILGVAPEFVYAYTGSIFAFALVILVFATIRLFVRAAYQRWWIFLVTVFGGGLGAHLSLLTSFDAIRFSTPVRVFIAEPLAIAPVFENYRGHYVFTAFPDTHFLLLWTVTTSAIASLYFTLRELTMRRLALTMFLYGAMTVLHLHEGVTLMAITAGVTVLCWAKRIAVRPALVTLVGTTTTVLVFLGWQGWLLRGSGLPVPTWREPIILVSILFLSYPLAWLFGFRGLAASWREARLEEVFLLGWVLGCLVLALSGPFNPRPSRGTLTLQIPLTILAGLAYFRWTARVNMAAALVIVLTMGVTPIFVMTRAVVNRPLSPAVYTYAAHRELIDVLKARARGPDVLLADRRELLWLAPEYPGRQYCAHFFLTVDFERKRAEVEQFFQATAIEQGQFFRDKGVRFLYVSVDQQPARFEGVDGLTLVKSTPLGALFEYSHRRAALNPPR